MSWMFTLDKHRRHPEKCKKNNRILNMKISTKGDPDFLFTLSGEAAFPSVSHATAQILREI